MSDHSPIIGRFAPSPTGPLHQGSLVAALGSYLLAKQGGGRWLLRIEDLDPPREVPGAANQIIDMLAEFGFSWDGEILWQSQRNAEYVRVFEELRSREAIYPCHCSRKQIIERSGGAYDGYCRRHPVAATGDDPGWRYRFADAPLRFKDEILGEQYLTSDFDCQDFIIKRRDGLFAYQLAVIVDDHLSGVSQVVRGADILDSTPRQISLLKRLGWAIPTYFHLPLVRDEQGHKLSKSKLAPGLSKRDKSSSLIAALKHLGQQPPDNLKSADGPSIIEWALIHFDAALIK